LLALSCGLARAIGDQGGCNGDAPFGKVLTEGSPSELEQAIQKVVSRQEDRRELGVFARLGQALRGQSEDPVSRGQAILDVIEGRSLSCNKRALLYHVVAAGNLPVLNYLLDSPMGVRVGVPQDILFECGHDTGMRDAQREGRRAAMGLLIDRGLADVRTLKEGKSLLQACGAPELVELFLEKGASTDHPGPLRAHDRYAFNALETSLIAAILAKEDSYFTNRSQEMSRARILAKATGATIRGRPTEAHIKWYCRSPSRAKACVELSTFIDASPGVLRPPRQGEPGYVSPEAKLHVLVVTGSAGIRGRLPSVTVNVADRSAPIVLALAANTRTSWQVVLREGVQLQKVLLVSPVDQVISGDLDATMVEVHSNETPSCKPCFWTEGYVHHDADKMAPRVAVRSTGLKVSSYLEAKHGQDVLITESPADSQ